MKYLLMLAVTTAFLFSCNNSKNDKGDMNGGGCSYKDEIHPAKLLALKKVDSLTYDGQFEIEAGIRNPDAPDTVFFHNLTNQYIKADDIAKDSIAPGKIYQYVIQTIVTGSCDPHIMTLRMKPYKSE